MYEKITDDARKQLDVNGSVTLTLRVHPHARQTAFKDILSDGSYKIDLEAPADDGKANEALVAFLAEEFRVSTDHVEIIVGQTNRRKVVRITG